MAVYIGVVLAIGVFVSLYTKSSAALYIALAFALLMNISSFWFANTIVMKMQGAQKANRKEHYEAWNALENICISIGQPMPELYIINDPSPNAFATGRSPEHSAIAVTTGLLDILNKKELEGVIAHELAHIQNRDTLLMVTTSVLMSVVTILLDMLLHASGFMQSREGRGNIIFIIIGIIAAYILLPLIMTIIQMAISRKREFLADATGAIYTRYPEGLASALEKISGMARPMKVQHASTAHLFIADPTAQDTGKKIIKKEGNFFTRVLSTHPPVAERIKRLRNA
ncbi:MAG: M48 family metallopeptidase [Alphaproteobacteria bacterium]|nr:M48 family metallopeptidase [Alphaproteobacteria bacterium]